MSQRYLTLIRGQGEDGTSELWEDGVLSRSGRFPGPEERNSRYKCPGFVAMIPTGHTCSACGAHSSLGAEKQKPPASPGGQPGLCREVAGPGLPGRLVITVTIWGSAVRRRGGGTLTSGDSRGQLSFKTNGDKAADLLSRAAEASACTDLARAGPCGI